jgi:hypothetical protein
MAQRDTKREILISSVIIILAFMILPLPTHAAGQEKPEDRPYLDIVGKLRGLGLQDEGAYEILRKIVSVGPRLTASPGAAAGVEIVR